MIPVYLVVSIFRQLLTRAHLCLNNAWCEWQYDLNKAMYDAARFHTKEPKRKWEDLENNKRLIIHSEWMKIIIRWSIKSSFMWRHLDSIYLLKIILLHTDLRRIVYNRIWRNLQRIVYCRILKSCRSSWPAENNSCRTHTKSCRTVTGDRRLFHALQYTLYLEHQRGESKW